MSRAHTSPENGKLGGRPRAPRATLVFRRYFWGDRKGDSVEVVSLTAAAIRRRLVSSSGQGWGCRVVLTAEQLAAVGGEEALRLDFAVEVEG